MPNVTYTTPDGLEHVVAGEEGSSVMDAAVKHGVAGIVAECGGFMNCASCHVYVADDWLGAVGPASEEEGDMLDGAMSERRPTSRLSCQIILEPGLDGLRVTVPPEQV